MTSYHIIIIIIFSILGVGYFLYWSIYQQYSPQRLVYRALRTMYLGFLALIGVASPFVGTITFIALVMAYIALVYFTHSLVIKIYPPIQQQPAPSGISPTADLSAVTAIDRSYSPNGERERLGHLLALRLIMADDPQYGLDEESAYLPNLEDDRAYNEGWHPDINAFIGTYGIADEPFIYFYYIGANSFIANGGIELAKKRYPGHRPHLIVEEITDIERCTIINAGIRVRSFAEIASDPNRLKIYKKWLQRNLNEPAGGVGPKLIDCAAPLSGEIRESSDHTVKITNVAHWLLEWVGDSSRTEQIALLGEYGQGKSVLVQQLALCLIENIDKFKRIPILIQLGGRSPRNQSPQELIGLWAQRFSISQNIVQYWIEEGSAVVIFDAFDKMDMVGDSNVVKEHFHTLWKFADARAPKILITGRPNLFLDQAEMEQALRLRGNASTVSRSSCSPVYLTMLNRTQIEQVLSLWPTHIKTGLMAAYDAAPTGSEFQDLVSRPSLLVQAAAIWPELERRAIVTDITSASLMREFLYATFIRKRKTLPTSIFGGGALPSALVSMS